MPYVSIIIPVYNSEQFIRRCVEGVLSQSYQDFELILVDDGSTDRSGCILDEYAAKDNRIIVIHKENGGISSARNAGLDAASGRFVYFIDSDDFIRPDLLEKALPGMEAGYDTVAFSFETVPHRKHNKNREGILCRKEKEIILDTDIKRYAFITGPFRRRAIRWEVWNKIFRRDLIEKWNIRFADNRRVFAEDMCFTYCYIAHISRIKVIPDVLYAYQRHQGSVSESNRDPLKIGTSNRMTEEIWKHYRNSSDCAYLCAHFSPLFYLLHKAALRRLRRYQWANHLRLEQTTEILKNNVSDYPAFVRTMKETFNSPVVRDSYRQDKGKLLQCTDRAFVVALLDIPVSRAERILGRAILCLSQALVQIRTEIKKYLLCFAMKHGLFGN